MPYHELVRDGLARVVGAQPSEVVAMNSLTANLHLMMVSFYRPTRERPAILMVAGAFPSDRYALESQVRFHRSEEHTSELQSLMRISYAVFCLKKKKKTNQKKRILYSST